MFGWSGFPEGSYSPKPSKEFIMQPRIYTYKVTFEEIPDWYWGSHKETKYNDGYLGSPKTHAWKWEFYTPHLQICELFPYTDEGWTEALEIEKRCIKQDLNNPLCLNENVGGFISLEVSRRNGERLCVAMHAEKDDLGRSLHTLKLHEEKDELGRSVVAMKSHKERDDLGRSVHAVKAGKACHEEKDELGRSVNAVKAGKKGAAVINAEKDELGRSVQGVKNAERMHKDRDELGRSVQGVKNAERMNKVLHEEKNEFGKSAHAVKIGKKGAKKMTTQVWKDPLHPELGEHNAGNLVQMQKRKGYPYGKENRVLVKQGNSK